MSNKTKVLAISHVSNKMRLRVTGEMNLMKQMRQTNIPEFSNFKEITKKNHDNFFINN
jgi:hypothetical protein